MREMIMNSNDNSEIEKLNGICREAKTAGKLSGTNLTELYELFGQDSPNHSTPSKKTA